MVWKNIELGKENAKLLRIFLSSQGIRYETSSAYNLVHFEILVDEATESRINEFLEVL